MNKMTTAVHISVIALLVAGSVSVANAAPVSDVVSGSGDVVFAGTGTASITVTPVTDLVAGKFSSLVIANAQATATAGNIAYRWTPDASVQRGTPLERTISGTNIAANKLDVASTATATQSNSHPDWWVADAGASTLDIEVRTTSTEQTIAADTYRVALDAAVWLP
ncbi:Saf-pilin pilus formation protein [Providencia rettgeri DSM 1131]|uniref:hypothetical protein n=1 Tax=Providencia rettgeri TaxID=587 RepID=UPI000197CC77|nr:hypothetical protein [Providencia rettgeri]EFE55238.1 Saf-pilin pilus formation protein [Providencia rettgeri DSM 1131]QXA59584.1 hypothetical protein I6L79_08785 [Providencia rettgeri]